MKHSEQNFGHDPEFQNEQKKFYSKISLQLLAEVHEKYLPLLYFGREQGEYWVLPSIRRALAIFQPDIELSVVPGFEFNYAYDGGMEDFVKRTVEKLERYLDKKNRGTVLQILTGEAQHPRWISFIHFPLIESSSALNLVTLAHELGHLIDQVLKIYVSIPVELEKSSYTKKLEEICKSPISGKNPPEKQLTLESVFTRADLEPQFRAQCIATTKNWIREVIADLIAIHGLGPAYFFAFSEMLAHSAQEDEPSSSHPAPTLRMNIQLEELAYLRYLPQKTGANSTNDVSDI